MIHSRAACTRFVILSPSSLVLIPRHFNNITVDPRRHDDLLAEMQRFRGGVYLSDCAIQPDDLTDGRHKVDVDEHGWHVLTLDSKGSIYSCLRYSDIYSVARYVVMDNRFRRALNFEMEKARQAKIGFGEVGGWAVAISHRSTRDAFGGILAMYGLMQFLGGCVGIATATVRHGSSAMLKRIGLNPLSLDGVELPSYYDPNYRCEMEMLYFDSRFPNQKYRDSVRELSKAMAASPVICRQTASLELAA